MNRETKKALKASIDHWYRISACETDDELLIEGWSSEDCPLCRMFDADRFLADGSLTRGHCQGCPVAASTGQEGCDGSPYKVASLSLYNWTYIGEWYNTDQDNLEAEIRFLESLLPD